MLNRPRISASIINDKMQPEPRGVRKSGGEIPIYSFSQGGIILASEHQKLRCAYSYDAGSLQYGDNGCNPRHCRDDASMHEHETTSCAYMPTGLQQMLQVQQELRLRNKKPWRKYWDDHK